MENNFHSVCFDNVGGAFVSLDTFLVFNKLIKNDIFLPNLIDFLNI